MILRFRALPRKMTIVMSWEQNIGLFIAFVLLAMAALESRRWWTRRKQNDGDGYPIGRLARRTASVLLLLGAMTLIAIAGRFESKIANFQCQLLAVVVALGGLWMAYRDIRGLHVAATFNNEAGTGASASLERAIEQWRAEEAVKNAESPSPPTETPTATAPDGIEFEEGADEES